MKKVVIGIDLSLRTVMTVFASETAYLFSYFIKIDIKRITYKKRNRTFRPIFSCNRCRFFGRESFFYLLFTLLSQILFLWILIFILDYHYQVFPLRVFHNSGINHTEIWIEEHLRL